MNAAHKTLDPLWRYHVAYNHQRGCGMTELTRSTPITEFDHLLDAAAEIRESVGAAWGVITSYHLLRVDNVDVHGMPLDPEFTARRAYEAWVGSAPGATAWDDLPHAAQNTWYQVGYAVQHALRGIPGPVVGGFLAF